METIRLTHFLNVSTPYVDSVENLETLITPFSTLYLNIALREGVDNCFLNALRKQFITKS